MTNDLAEVVDMALDGLQDDVAEATRGTRWPDDPASKGPLALSWARIDAGRLVFGYGTKTLGGIRLNDLGA